MLGFIWQDHTVLQVTLFWLQKVKTSKNRCNVDWGKNEAISFPVKLQVFVESIE